MASSRDPGRSRTTLVVLVLISITVIALDTRGFGPLNTMKSGVGAVFSPVRAVGDAVFGPVGDAFNGVFNRSDLRAENDDLRRQLDQLRGERAQAQEAAAELEAMRETLNLPNLDDIVKTHAEVITGPVSNFDRTVTINKGANAGIRRGMPVITAAGLVGRIVEVSLSSSNVQLITDPGFRIGVKHVLSGDIGVAVGEGEGRPLRVDVGLDASTEISPGDFFTTSGVERSLFPPGVTVGIAVHPVSSAAASADSGASTPTTSAATSGRQIEQTVDIEPAADLDHLAFVSVMLWNPS